MASRTVMVLNGADSKQRELLMRRSSIWKASCIPREENVCRGCGYSGSFSPGAAARMITLEEKRTGQNLGAKD